MQLGRGRAGALAVSGLLLAIATCPPARAADRNDIREFRVGMAVADLPSGGYGEFTCTAEPTRKIAAWSQYKECPADAAGRHEVGFRYDLDANPMSSLNESYNGTRVGGHPVVISLLLGDDAQVDAIRIDTDPHARLYMRKKAFLLADQVKERYGKDGWACKEGTPSADEQPVGGIFIKEHCEKTTASRRFILDRDLYRDPNKDVTNFVGSTRLLIERNG